LSCRCRKDGMGWCSWDRRYGHSSITVALARTAIVRLAIRIIAERTEIVCAPLEIKPRRLAGSFQLIWLSSAPGVDRIRWPLYV
jgi:hypothetical protein